MIRKWLDGLPFPARIVVVVLVIITFPIWMGPLIIGGFLFMIGWMTYDAIWDDECQYCSTGECGDCLCSDEEDWCGIDKS